MARLLKDMSGARPAQPLDERSTALKRLVAYIFHEDATSVVQNGQKVRYFYNHRGDDQDPAYNGTGRAPGNVRVDVYYEPANQWEYNHWEVIRDAAYMKSGRRRLAVRTERSGTDELVSFYTMTHPASKIAGVRNNSYGQYTALIVRLPIFEGALAPNLATCRGAPGNGGRGGIR